MPGLAVGGLALGAIFGYGQIDWRSPIAGGWDLHAYLAMAAAVPGLAREVPAPFPAPSAPLPLALDLAAVLLVTAGAYGCRRAPATAPA
jgi:hypothetical protein